MGYLMILGKGLTSLFVLFILSKIMGRKQVSELNLFDYIIGISIGSIAAEMTLNPDIDFFEGVFAIAIYALVAYLITILTMKSIMARRIIIGTPTMLLQKGQVLYHNLRKSKIDINDLLQKARTNGYFDLSQIEYALMEANGKISFLPKSKYQPVIKKDLKLPSPFNGLCANVVIDGNVMPANLKAIGKDEQWLRARLNKLHYNTIENLLLVTVDSNEQLAVFIKEKRDGNNVLE